MRRIGLLVALLSVLLLVGLGLLVARALESVENERAMRHEVLAERVFDEMEEALTEITEREEARPFLQYRFFFVPEDQVGANPALSRSPLSHVPEDDWLLGWFQLDPGGGITTPFVPEDGELGSSIGWSKDSDLEARVARLKAIAAKVPVKPVDRRPVAEAPAKPAEETKQVPTSTGRASSITTAPARTKAPKKPTPTPKKDDELVDELADAGSYGQDRAVGGKMAKSSGSKSSTSTRDPYGIGSLNKGATKRADRQQRVTKSNADNLRSYQFPEENQALLANESDLPQVGFEGETGEVVAQVAANRDQWDANAGGAGGELMASLDAAGAEAGVDARDKNEELDVLAEELGGDGDAVASGEFADLDVEDLAEEEDERQAEVSVAASRPAPDYAPAQRKRRRVAAKEKAVPPVFGRGPQKAKSQASAPAAEPVPAEAVAAEPVGFDAERAASTDEPADDVAGADAPVEPATGGLLGGTATLSDGKQESAEAGLGQRAEPVQEKAAELAREELGAVTEQPTAVMDDDGDPEPEPAPEPEPEVLDERRVVERVAPPPPPEPQRSAVTAVPQDRDRGNAQGVDATVDADEEVDVEISPFRGQRVDAQTLVLFRTVRIGDIEYVQGLALLLPQLADWLEDAVLDGSDVQDFLELAWNGGLASRRGPAPDFSFAHTFAEPFTDLAVTSYLRALPEARGSGRAWILQLTAALVIVGLLGLAALWRMISVVVHFAERRNNFVAAVSHELKTPLTAIRMYAEMLRDGYVLSEDKRGEYYETMAAESERLSRLIQNVLELSRLEKGSSAGGDLVTGDVRPVLEEAVRVLERHAKDRGFRIALDVPDDLPAVRYERDGLLQVLINLVDNGIKFSKASDEKVVVVEAIPRGGGVVLQIRDHGPGVPSKQLGNIFQPFYRGERELTRRTKGTGIGLALVKGIVERMGGNVSARNHPDGGFEVRVALAAA